MTVPDALDVIRAARRELGDHVLLGAGTILDPETARMALLAGEPDLPEPPTRRLVVSVFAGLMVGVLVVAGFGVWGLLSPGGATGL